MRIPAFTMLAVLLAGCAQTEWKAEAVPSGTSSLLQAISLPADGSVWISGHNGTVARSTDGGRTFDSHVVPGADTLQFRDIFAFNAQSAVLMTAGTGPLSTLWTTRDGGRTFDLVFQNEHPQVFFDCIDFWENGTGLLFGDSVEGDLFVMRSADSGRTWQRIPPGNLPVPLAGEGAFAASGTCLSVQAGGRVAISTAAGSMPRVLVSTDSGKTFTVQEVPGEAGEASGWASVAWDGDRLVMGGGNIALRDARQKNIAEFDGSSWRTGSVEGMKGAVYGVGLHRRGGLLAAGPGGLFLRPEGGPWQRLDTLSMWSAAWKDRETAFAAGPAGRIYRISPR